jgi:Na+/serine symporter
VSIHLQEVCRAISSSAQVLVSRIVWFTPLGVASLLLSDLVRQENLLAMMSSLSWYLLTVSIIIAVHGFLVVPLVFFLVCRKNPYKLLLGTVPVPWMPSMNRDFLERVREREREREKVA